MKNLLIMLMLLISTAVIGYLFGLIITSFWFAICCVLWIVTTIEEIKPRKTQKYMPSKSVLDELD